MCNHCCRGNNKYYISWVCVWCSLKYPACNVHVLYCHLWPLCLCSIFPHYLIKVRLKKKKLFKHKMCFDFLCNFCLKHFSFQELSKIPSKMYTCLHIKYQLFLSEFNETWFLFTDNWKILKLLISWKSIQWESRCFVRTVRWHMDKQTWGS